MIDVNLLCNPYLGEPFKRSEDQLIGLASGQKFPIKNGIPIILDRTYLSSRNRINRFIYNQSAFYYEKLLNIGDSIKHSQDLEINRNFINSLITKADQKILEIGIGTGLSTNFLQDDVEHIGIDISWRMLQKAKLNMISSKREPKLIQALAEYIPIKDNSMDIVFQIGTLQFTEDPFRAVSEMARVAKPGSQIFIVDEIRGGMKIFKRSPAHGMHVNSPDDLINELHRLVPHSMINIKSSMLPGNQFFQLAFIKPAIVK